LSSDLKRYYEENLQEEQAGIEFAKKIEAERAAAAQKEAEGGMECMS